MTKYIAVGMAEDRRIWWAPWRRRSKMVVWFTYPVEEDVPLKVVADFAIAGPMLKIDDFALLKRQGVPA